LKPGEQTELLVRFKTAGMSGKVQRKVVVYSNDMEHNAVSLSISALVKPVLEFFPQRFEVTLREAMHQSEIILEIRNRSVQKVSLISMRSTTPALKLSEEIPEKIEPGDEISVPFAVQLHGEEGDATLRNGYIIIEAKGSARSKSRIPVIFKNSTN
jgi:hypothetical protein